MAEVIVFPDVEDVLRGHLTAELPPRIAGVKVLAGSLPKTLPAKSVLVRRTGGPSDSLVLDRAQVTFECRASTEGGASQIARTVTALVRAAALAGQMGDVPVYSVSVFSEPYLDPDPVNPKHARYSATIQVVQRGTAA